MPLTKGKQYRTPREIMTLQSLARSYTNMAVRTVAHICQQGESEMARLAAAQILLDRGWGKPPTHVANGAGSPVVVEIVYRARDPADASELTGPTKTHQELMNSKTIDHEPTRLNGASVP